MKNVIQRINTIIYPCLPKEQGRLQYLFKKILISVPFFRKYELAPSIFPSIFDCLFYPSTQLCEIILTVWTFFVLWIKNKTCCYWFPVKRISLFLETWRLSIQILLYFLPRFLWLFHNKPWRLTGSNGTKNWNGSTRQYLSISTLLGWAHWGCVSFSAIISGWVRVFTGMDPRDHTLQCLMASRESSQTKCQ